MNPCKRQFLQRVSEKSTSDDYAPNSGDTIICWNAGSTLKTFVQKNQSTVSPPFLERFLF